MMSYCRKTDLKVFTIVVMTIVNCFMLSNIQAQSGDTTTNFSGQHINTQNGSENLYDAVDQKALEIPIWK